MTLKSPISSVEWYFLHEYQKTYLDTQTVFPDFTVLFFTKHSTHSDGYEYWPNYKPIDQTLSLFNEQKSLIAKVSVE